MVGTRIPNKQVTEDSAEVGAARAAQTGITAKLAVKPNRKTKRKLDDRGRARVRAKVAYTPDGGTSNTKSKRIKLKKRLR